jgi:hypothetical protein
MILLCFMAGVAVAQDELPRYEPATCPLEGGEGRDDVQCGYHLVPENRERPDGRTLCLAVAAWKQRWWNAASRVHYVLVAVACVGFVVWISRLGLI